MNLGWLLLVLSLELTEASYYLFDRIQEVVRPEPRPAIHMEKQLGWAHKLDVAESVGSPRWVNSVSQAYGISDMAPACWLC